MGNFNENEPDLLLEQIVTTILLLTVEAKTLKGKDKKKTPKQREGISSYQNPDANAGNNTDSPSIRYEAGIPTKYYDKGRRMGRVLM